MKLLFDFQNMSGGAPRSQLAHALAMKKLGHEVIATIDTGADILAAKADGIRVIEVPEWQARNPLATLANISRWLRLLRHENPDLVYSNRMPNSKFLSVAADIGSVPFVPAQAGGEVCQFDIKPLVDKVVVVYSPENVRAYLSSGFPPGRIHLIPNRLSTPAHQSSPTPATKKDVVGIVFTGNIKKQTIRGMIAVIDLLATQIDAIEHAFVCEFIGGPTAGSERLEAELHAHMDRASNRLGRKGCFKYLGWVDDVTSRQLEAVVCLGKGRSIVEPAMAGKIAFVVSEDGTLIRITRKTFKKLAEYNFSGRGQQEMSNRELVKAINDVECRSAFELEAVLTVDVLRRHFHVCFAAEKLQAAFDDAIRSHEVEGRWKSFVRGCGRLVAIYAYGALKSYSRWRQ